MHLSSVFHHPLCCKMLLSRLTQHAPALCSLPTYLSQQPSRHKMHGAALHQSHYRENRDSTPSSILHRREAPINYSIIRHNSNEASSDKHKVQLTSERFPQLKRNDSYATLNETDIEYFKKLLPGRVVSDEDELDGANTDWMYLARGASKLMLKPKTTQEVSEILTYCNSRCLAVTPQGGNTGLVGGSVPVFDEIILSMSLMNNNIHLDKASGVLVCQAGCILETLSTYLEEHGLIMPLDLGAKGSCQIGGNVSTNAGGLRLLRYGSLRGNVLGVEAVLADGTIIDCLSTLRKDNTGYDLKNLFIGSEGTLGVVTAVAIQCPPKPKAVSMAFLGCSSYENVLATYNECKNNCAEILSAFELMDMESMRFVTTNLGLSNPLGDCPFYVVVETSGSDPHHDEEKLNKFLEVVMEQQYVMDGTIATEPSKIYALWQLRERINESMMHSGVVYKYDISLPLEVYYDIVVEMRQRLGDNVLGVVGYGHIGDGNLHLNACASTLSKTVTDLLEPFVYEWTAKHKGSISSEHGLGFNKKNYIYYSKSEAAVDLMVLMKKQMDPKCILNPYKTLPVQNNKSKQ